MEAREESSAKELKRCLGFLKETGSRVPSSAGVAGGALRTRCCGDCQLRPRPL